MPSNSIEAPKQPVPPQLLHTVVRWVPLVQCQVCAYSWYLRLGGKKLPHERPCPACGSNPWWTEGASEAWLAKRLQRYERLMSMFYTKAGRKMQTTKAKRRIMTATIAKALRIEKNKALLEKTMRRLMGISLYKKASKKGAEKARKQELRRRIKRSPDVSDLGAGAGAGYVGKRIQRSGAQGRLGQANDAVLRREPPARRWNDVLGTESRGEGEEPDGV